MGDSEDDFKGSQNRTMPCAGLVTPLVRRRFRHGGRSTVYLGLVGSGLARSARCSRSTVFFCAQALGQKVLLGPLGMRHGPSHGVRMTRSMRRLRCQLEACPILIETTMVLPGATPLLNV